MNKTYILLNSIFEEYLVVSGNDISCNGVLEEFKKFCLKEGYNSKDFKLYLVAEENKDNEAMEHIISRVSLFAPKWKCLSTDTQDFYSELELTIGEAITGKTKAELIAEFLLEWEKENFPKLFE